MTITKFLVHVVVGGAVFATGCPFLMTLAIVVYLGMNKLIKWSNAQ